MKQNSTCPISSEVLIEYWKVQILVRTENSKWEIKCWYAWYFRAPRSRLSSLSIFNPIFEYSNVPMINLNILMYTVHGQTLFIFTVKSVGNSIQYGTGKRSYLSIFWVNEVGVFSCLHCIKDMPNIRQKLAKIRDLYQSENYQISYLLCISLKEEST